MSRPGFEDDTKYCPNCRTYVRYLDSPSQSWCTQCDTPVRLFSNEDHARFRQELPRASSPFRARISRSGSEDLETAV